MRPTVVPDGGLAVTVDEPDLTYVAVNFQTRLRFGSTEFVIESPFAVEDRELVHHLNPEHREGLGPLLALYPCRLSDATIHTEGVLRLNLVCGVRITVPSDETYEAWSVVGPDQRLIVCQPGGAVAIWP